MDYFFNLYNILFLIFRLLLEIKLETVIEVKKKMDYMSFPKLSFKKKKLMSKRRILTYRNFLKEVEYC